MDMVDQPERDTDTAGVVARPPHLFLGALLLGMLLDAVLPLRFPAWTGEPGPWLSAALGGLVVLVGLAIAAAGIRNFTRAATPVPGNQPVSALVTGGIHGWSRNPIYVGMFALYAGIGLGLRSPWVLLLVLPLFVTMRVGVVAREEAYLERRFGGPYRDYRARVRRWL